MRVNKNDLDRLRYLARELNEREENHLWKVLNSVINNIELNKYVYVLHEEGSWDYELTSGTDVFTTYKDALEAAKKLKHQALIDMKEWDENAKIDEQESEPDESYNFEIYQDGDFTRLHDTITIKRKEVLENA